MKVLIIGGTGFIGRRIVHKLLTQRHSVTLFTRGRVQPEFWSEIESIIGDRKDAKDSYEQLAGSHFDAVIDNIAYNRLDVDTAIRTFAGHIGHYVLCSSGAVYRDYTDSRQFRPFYEDEADLTFTGDLAYAEGKRTAELALWSIRGTQPPFPFSIMRPSVVEGPEDPSGRTWFWVQRVADGRDVLVPQTIPTTVFRHAFVDDVADAFVRAIANPMAFYRAYNLTGEEILSLEEYVRAIAEALGREAKIVLAPLEQIRRQPGLANFYPPFVGERFVQDISRAKQDLKWEPTSLDIWLRKTVDYFLNDYHGEDSKGYANREMEVEAAQRLRSD